MASFLIIIKLFLYVLSRQQWLNDTNVKFINFYDYLFSSDLVVQIIDARNPLLFRCPDLEAYVTEVNEKKSNMLLLNKADFLTEQQRYNFYMSFHFCIIICKYNFSIFNILRFGKSKSYYSFENYLIRQPRCLQIFRRLHFQTLLFLKLKLN